PEDAGKGLALNATEILVSNLALQLCIEGIRLGFARGEDLVKIGEGRRLGLAETQSDPDGRAVLRRHRPPINSGRLRARARTDRVRAALDQVVVEAVLVPMP